MKKSYQIVKPFANPEKCVVACTSFEPVIGLAEGYCLAKAMVGIGSMRLVEKRI